MKKSTLILLIITCSFCFGNITCNSGNTKNKKWVRIKTWKGAVDLDSEEFTINSSNWRIIYYYDSPHAIPGCFFSGKYYSKSNGLIKEQLFVNDANGYSDKDTVYFAKQGVFSIQIDMVNCEWGVAVEEERSE